MKGALSWLVHWACRVGTVNFCSASAALVGQVQNIFFLTILYINSFVPIPQQVGQATVLGHLSVSMDLWYPLAKKRDTKIRPVLESYQCFRDIACIASIMKQISKEAKN
jgi:hypothetical protein